MKTARIRNNKSQNKQKTETISEEYSLKKISITLISLVAIFFIFYFITTVVVKPNKNNNTDNTMVDFDSTKIILSHLLDRKEEEYFVIAYKGGKSSSKVNYQELYNTYINDYKKKEGSLNFYSADLDDVFNKNFISENTNITDDINELRLNDEALFKIKNGKIEENYIGHSDIIEKLSSLKKS